MIVASLVFLHNFFFALARRTRQRKKESAALRGEGRGLEEDSKRARRREQSGGEKGARVRVPVDARSSSHATRARSLIPSFFFFFFSLCFFFSHQRGRAHRTRAPLRPIGCVARSERSSGSRRRPLFYLLPVRAATRVR